MKGKQHADSIVFLGSSFHLLAKCLKMLQESVLSSIHTLVGLNYFVFALRVIFTLGPGSFCGVNGSL